MAHGDLLEEGSRLLGRETHRKEHLPAGLYGFAVVCDLRAVARRVGLYHHDGLVRAVLRSDAHLTAPAERKLAQIDRPVVEQQQNPMSVDHDRRFSGTYSPSWASIFSNVDLNSAYMASPDSGLPSVRSGCCDPAKTIETACRLKSDRSFG